MLGHSELAGYIRQAARVIEGRPTYERLRRVRGGNAAGRGAGLAVRQHPAVTEAELAARGLAP